MYSISGEMIDVWIFDVSGREVMNDNVEYAEKVIVWRPAEDLPSGVYLVRAIDRDGYVSEPKRQVYIK